MEQSVQPSFIPRDAMQIPHQHQSGRRGLLDLFTLLSIVLFVASGAMGVGVFLYNQFLEVSGASKVEQLGRASAAFEPALIHELARLDDRMRAASEVLGSHIAPSAFFRMLEQTTIRTVSFRSLTLDAIKQQRITIRMDGVADSVNSIALQADLLSKVGMVTSPIFSNIDRRIDGVHFNLSGLLDSTALSYTALVRGIQQTVPQIPAESSTPLESLFQPELPPGEEVLDEESAEDTLL